MEIRENVKLGSKIKEVFNHSGLRKSDFADRAGIHRSYVSKLFEKESLDTELLRRISVALEYNFFELFKYDQQDVNWKEAYDELKNAYDELKQEKEEKELMLLKELNSAYKELTEKERSERRLIEKERSERGLSEVEVRERSEKEVRNKGSQ